jgi:hypothetical protein
MGHVRGKLTKAFETIDVRVEKYGDLRRISLSADCVDSVME